VSLKIKICGLRESQNIIEVAALHPDMMGFILYPASPRYAGLTMDHETLQNISPTIIKTGVFVNDDFKTIIESVEKFSLDCVQLHGAETPDLCFQLKGKGLRVIKTFNITVSYNFNKCSDYIPVTDYFLFDTAVAGFGGSGYKFDWQELNNYNLEHPFILSGGISSDDISKLTEVKNPSFSGIDLNSRFEIRPGLKDFETLKNFISKIRQKG
jgi:phosphoribosylanthranilate isomerase